MKSSFKKYRLPRLFQTSANESGAVALGIALACFDKYLSIAELRKLTSTNQFGTTTDKLLSAIHQCSLIGDWVCYDNRSSQLSVSLSQQCYPAIVHEGKGKFYTLLECEDESALLYSPTQGLIHLSINDLVIDSILGLSPGPMFVSGGKPFSIWTILFSLAAKVKAELILLVVLTITAIIPNLLIAACTSQFIDQFLENKYYSFALPIIWIAAISLVVVLSIRLLTDLIMRRFNFVLMRILARDVYQYVMTKERQYFLERSSGSIAYRMMAPYLLTYSIGFALLGPILNLLFGVFLVIFSSLISLPLSLVLLVGSSINMYTSYLTTSSTSDDLSAMQREQSEMNSSLYAILQYVEEYKSISAEFAALERWHNHFYALLNIQQTINLKNNFRNIASNASVFLTEVLVLCIGGILIIQGMVSLGTLLAFLFIQSRVNDSLSAIPSISQAWQNLIGLLMSFGDLQQATIDPSIDIFDRNSHVNPAIHHPQVESRDLRIMDLSYSASQLDPPILSDFNLSVLSGQHLLIESTDDDLATTLFNLVSGMIQPTSGVIQLGGIDIGSFPAHYLRKLVAYVGSSAPFFDDSIMNNITLKRSLVDPNMLDEVCKTVDLDKFANRFKDAYQARLINPSGFLSVSEKYQFSIARALITEPLILILDLDIFKIDSSVELSIYQYCRKNSITVISTSCRPKHQSDLDAVVCVHNLQHAA